MTTSITGPLLARLIALGMPKNIGQNLSDYDWDESSNKGKLASVNAHLVNDWLLERYGWWVTADKSGSTIRAGFDCFVQKKPSASGTNVGRSFPDQYAALIAGIEYVVADLEKRLFRLQNA